MILKWFSILDVDSFGCGEAKYNRSKARKEEFTVQIGDPEGIAVRLGFPRVLLELSVSRLKMKLHGLEKNGRVCPMGSPIYRLLG